MKRFIIWLVITVLVYAVLFGAAHFVFSNNPKRIVVAIDTSVGMKKSDYRIKNALKKILTKRYSLFTIITDKSKLTDWSKKPAVPRTFKYYGPQDLNHFVKMSGVVDFSAAQQVYFITNSEAPLLKEKFPKAKIVVIK